LKMKSPPGCEPDELKEVYMEEYSPARSAFQSPRFDLADLLGPEQGNLAAALDLARRGFAIFPVQDWGDGDGWKPIKEFPEKASADLACVRAWWTKWPEARVGLLTGERNGITVLDVDIKNGKDGAASLAALGFPALEAMSPVQTMSPSGGWHLFFRFDPAIKGTVGQIGAGLDVRNRNQFVLAPDSLKNGQRYRVVGKPLGSTELPPFPPSLIPPPRPERDAVELVSSPTQEQLEWAASQLLGKAAQVADTTQGGRQAALNNAAFWAGGAGAHGMLKQDQAREALVPAGVTAGLSEREVQLSFEHGWGDGLKSPISDFPQDYGEMFEDLPPRSANDLTELLSDTAVAPAVSAESKIGIIRAKSGDMKPTLHNAILVLRKVNQDKGFHIRKNDFTGEDEWCGGPLTDPDLGVIRVSIEQAGMHNVGSTLTADSVVALATAHHFHPIREWLGTLRYDGTPRLDKWLTRYLGADDSPYTRAVGRAFLVAMVARVMKPGCKHDHVLVLGGDQGIGKSTVCKILGGDWFGDNMPSIRDGAKEAGIYIPGHWLIELAELAPSRKAEAEDLKAFLTRATDEIRVPYDRKPRKFSRQCVFVGTTNETAFLRDVTGGRRFWPVTCGVIDSYTLAHDRDQLFAEALAAFNAGEQWHLASDIEQLASSQQEAARQEDTWECAIADYLEGDDTCNQAVQSITARDLLTRLGVTIERQSQSNVQRVTRILRLMGWERLKKRDGWTWVRK
jgi:hypothetical protein